MYCPKCGHQNFDDALLCSNCGASFESAPNAPQPEVMAAGSIGAVPNYLVQAILVTLFCCLPFGIVAIVYAAQVNGKVAAGDSYGALDASRKAKTWCWVSFGCGLAVSLLYLMGVILSVVLSASQNL